MVSQVDEAKAFHQKVFDDEAAVLAFAPGRVNIIGEHVDYNDGVVLPFAIAQGVYCAISPNQLQLDRITSSNRMGEIIELQHGQQVNNSFPHWATYILGAIESFRPNSSVANGFNMSISSDLPEGAGLSSSAALENATLMALKDFYGLEILPMDVAKLAQRIEHEYAGNPCGIMDQVASIFGVPKHALFFDIKSEKVSLAACDPEANGYVFLICDTNIPHELASSEYSIRRQQCESAALKLGIASLREYDGAIPSPILSDVENSRLLHVSSEIDRVMRARDTLEDSQWLVLGQLLNESHNSLRDNYQVSISPIDRAIDAARDAGAAGARILGGGFGGSVLVLTELKYSEAIKCAMTTELQKHKTVPRFLVATPSRGAAILVSRPT